MSMLTMFAIARIVLTVLNRIIFPRDSFIVDISMHFWATVDVVCSGSQGDHVSPVRGARDAPPMKSVSYHAVCAVISVSSDVKV